MLYSDNRKEVVRYHSRCIVRVRRGEADIFCLGFGKNTYLYFGSPEEQEIQNIIPNLLFIYPYMAYYNQRYLYKIQSILYFLYFGHFIYFNEGSLECMYRVVISNPLSVVHINFTIVPTVYWMISSIQYRKLVLFRQT